MDSPVNQAVQLARKAYTAYAGKKLARREEIVQTIRLALLPEAIRIAEMTFQETGVGVVTDKVEKIHLAISQTPGIEDLPTEVNTTDDGMTLYELSPYGVVCAVHPYNNPIATLINVTISALAAGNAVIHCPHCRAQKTSAYVVERMNEAIKKVSGIDHLVGILEESSQAARHEIMAHPDVDCIIITGSDTAISGAMRADKKVIGAGPANPPVIIDSSADILCAAEDIVNSASFDNNMLCVTEEAIVVVDAVADAFISQMQYQGALYLEDMEDILKLTGTILDEDLKPKKIFCGRTAEEILATAGLQGNGETRLIIVETIKEHPLAIHEMLMPVVPIIRVKDFDEAMEAALFIEQGYHHTAVIHSQNIAHLNYAARVMGTAIFVKNGPAYAGIGYKNAGGCSFSVATRTGEGTVTARHLARRRRCTLMSAFILR